MSHLVEAYGGKNSTESDRWYYREDGSLALADIDNDRTNRALPVEHYSAAINIMITKYSQSIMKIL